MTPRSLLVLGLAILAIHPVALAVSALLDTVIGDGAMWFDLAEVPKRVLAHWLVSDWLAAMPVTALACGGTAIVGWLAPTCRPARWAFAILLAALLILPLLPGVPLMLGTTGLMAAGVALVWHRQVVP